MRRSSLSLCIFHFLGLPITASGNYTLTLSGGGIGASVTKHVSVGEESVRLDHLVAAVLLAGDVNGDGSITPVDALLAFQHVLGLANPPLDASEQDHANVDNPAGSRVTPADALCIFQYFLGLPSCLD